MSLVPDYDDSLSSTDSDSSSDGNINRQSEKILPKLPTPDFLGTTPPNSDGPSSVFKNPFTEAENAKEAILQKHVKMVDAKDNAVVINGKKICWNYRKGRCRFGHNCKYAHDSDLQRSEVKDVEKTVICQRQTLPEPSTQELERIRQEGIKENRTRKKRPGLTQGLVPGKKVMKSYANQKL